jgi:hypothetical protein
MLYLTENRVHHSYKADIADVFSEIILFFILKTMTLVNILSIFKKSPEFAGIIGRNSLELLTGTATVYK